jgi:hypothetical protein
MPKLKRKSKWKRRKDDKIRHANRRQNEGANETSERRLKDKSRKRTKQ